MKNSILIFILLTACAKKTVNNDQVEKTPATPVVVVVKKGPGRTDCARLIVRADNSYVMCKYRGQLKIGEQK